MRMMKKRMKAQYERDKKTTHSFNVGDMVMLQATDVKIHQPSPKLGPRQLGLFKILERIGDLDFKLELSGWLKLHPVFHVNQLSPYRDNGLAKPPPPDSVVVDGEEEYEVEAIVGHKTTRGGIRYQIKWKGYSSAENTWEPESALIPNAKEILQQYKKAKKLQ